MSEPGDRPSTSDSGQLTTKPADQPITPKPTSREEKRLAWLARQDAIVRREALKVVRGIPDGALIDDHGPPDENGVPTDPVRPAGWDDVRFRVARDARKPLRSQPGYISQCQRIAESYQKAERDKPAAPQLNVSVAHVTVHNHAPPGGGPAYPVIDVTGRDGRR